MPFWAISVDSNCWLLFNNVIFIFPIVRNNNWDLLFRYMRVYVKLTKKNCRLSCQLVKCLLSPSHPNTLAVLFSRSEINVSSFGSPLCKICGNNEIKLEHTNLQSNKRNEKKTDNLIYEIKFGVKEWMRKKKKERETERRKNLLHCSSNSYYLTKILTKKDGFQKEHKG